MIKSSNPKPPSGGIFLAVMQRERRSVRLGHSCPLADTWRSSGHAPPEAGREELRPRPPTNIHGHADRIKQSFVEAVKIKIVQ